MGKMHKIKFHMGEMAGNNRKNFPEIAGICENFPVSHKNIKKYLKQNYINHSQNYY
jgi:hypothetical protein